MADPVERLTMDYPVPVLAGPTAPDRTVQGRPGRVSAEERDAMRRRDAAEET